jgi:hypothetical protein
MPVLPFTPNDACRHPCHGAHQRHSADLHEPFMIDEYSRARLVQQPGGKQCVSRDETELVAEWVCAIKASLAPGLSFDSAQNDGS